MDLSIFTSSSPLFTVLSIIRGKPTQLTLNYRGKQRWSCEFPSNQFQESFAQLKICSTIQLPIKINDRFYPLIQGECLIPQAESSLQVGVLYIQIGLQKLDLILTPAGMDFEEWDILLNESQSLLDALANNSPIGIYHAHHHILSRLERIRELIIAIDEVLQNPKTHLTHQECWGKLGVLTPSAQTPMSYLQTLSPLHILGTRSVVHLDIPENRFLRYATHAAQDALYHIVHELTPFSLENRFDEGILSSQDQERSQYFDEADQRFLTSNQKQHELLVKAHSQIESLNQKLQATHTRLDYLDLDTLEEFVPTLTLVQDPRYARVYQAFLSLDQESPCEPNEEIDLQIAAPRNNLEAWRLYEGWCGLRILAELRSLEGFEYSDLDPEWIQAFSYLSNYSKYTHQKKHEQIISFSLHHTQILSLKYHITLKCQPLEMIEGHQRFPDYVLEIKHPQGQFSCVFDAKFKRYRSFDAILGEVVELWASEELSWLSGILKDKESHLHQEVMGRGYGLKGQRPVFILHPSSTLFGYQGSDRRAMAKRSYNGGSYYKNGKVHALSESFGFISMAPKRSRDLKVWLRWLILYYWRVDRPTDDELPCVSCGTSLLAIQVGGTNHYQSASKEKRSIGKSAKARNYSCECGVHLSLTRCYQCHYPLFKAGQFWTPPGLSTDYNLDCPRCGDHLPRGSLSLLQRNIEREEGYRKIRCSRCNGRGYIPRFKNYNGGVCYQYNGYDGCGGTGYKIIRDPSSDAEVTHLSFADHSTALDRSTFRHSIQRKELPTQEGNSQINIAKIT